MENCKVMSGYFLTKFNLHIQASREEKILQKYFLNVWCFLFLYSFHTSRWDTDFCAQWPPFWMFCHPTWIYFEFHGEFQRGFYNRDLSNWTKGTGVLRVFREFAFSWSYDHFHKIIRRFPQGYEKYLDSLQISASREKIANVYFLYLWLQVQ